MTEFHWNQRNYISHLANDSIHNVTTDRLEESTLHWLWGLLDMVSWTSFSVITPPSRILSGWNLEYKWLATVRTHTRKMGEIAPGVPPHGAKTCCILLSMQRGLSATYPAPISIFSRQQMWIAFRMRTPVKNVPISARGFPGPKTAQNTVL